MFSLAAAGQKGKDEGQALKGVRGGGRRREGKSCPSFAKEEITQQLESFVRVWADGQNYKQKHTHTHTHYTETKLLALCVFA